MPFLTNKSIRLEKGLCLEERKGAANYKARASLSGQVFFYNTETADYARAERLARSWFKRLGDAPSAGAHPMKDAAKAFLASLVKPVRRQFYTKQWDAISTFWQARDVEDVTTPVLKEFMRWRLQKAPVKPTTQRKDFVCIRRILRWSAEEGWIDRIPVFPRLDKVEANPRPWLDTDEWKTLQRVSRERIENEDNPRTKRQKEELHDFIIFMVHSCCRVDELRHMRVRDCTVRTLPNVKRPYLDMRVTGKTGFRKSVGWAGAVTAYERLVKRRDLKPDDRLFAEHHRDGFRELLEAAGLRTDVLGNPRNLKSLRSTGLMMRIKANPRINLKLLAENSGTSVTMLDTFYLKRLTVDMGVEELV
ncbi:MAG: hypothetical protein ACOYD0_13095 [Candidatus Nanopelagicales bacterium]